MPAIHLLAIYVTNGNHMTKGTLGSEDDNITGEPLGGSYMSYGTARACKRACKRSTRLQVN